MLFRSSSRSFSPLAFLGTSFALIGIITSSLYFNTNANAGRRLTKADLKVMQSCERIEWPWEAEHKDRYRNIPSEKKLVEHAKNRFDDGATLQPYVDARIEDARQCHRALKKRAPRSIWIISPSKVRLFAVDHELSEVDEKEANGELNAHQANQLREKLLIKQQDIAETVRQGYLPSYEVTYYQESCRTTNRRGYAKNSDNYVEVYYHKGDGNRSWIGGMNCDTFRASREALNIELDSIVREKWSPAIVAATGAGLTYGALTAGFGIQKWVLKSKHGLLTPARWAAKKLDKWGRAGWLAQSLLIGALTLPVVYFYEASQQGLKDLIAEEEQTRRMWIAKFIDESQMAAENGTPLDRAKAGDVLTAVHDQVFDQVQAGNISPKEIDALNEVIYAQTGIHDWEWLDKTSEDFQDFVTVEDLAKLDEPIKSFFDKDGEYYTVPVDIEIERRETEYEKLITTKKKNRARYEIVED